MNAKEEDQLRKIVVQKIKMLRKQHNVTLEVFYNDTGIHLARIEQGEINITLVTLKRICDYFNIKTSFFLNEISL